MKRFLKVIFTGFLLFGIPFVSMAEENKEEPYLEKLNINFKQEIHENELNCSIYYLPLNFSTLAPYDTEELTKGAFFYKIEISNYSLIYYVAALNKLNDVKLEKPIEHNKPDVRIFCKFTTKNGEILSFSLGKSPNMLVNGSLYKSKKTFYEAIIPFLPSSEVGSYQNELKKMDD